MASKTCRICLLTLDNADAKMSPFSEDGDATHETLLWFKLKSIGFLQIEEERKQPCQLCDLCAARVEDAYDLKLQCLKASGASTQTENTNKHTIKGLIMSDPLHYHVQYSATNDKSFLSSEEMAEDMVEDMADVMADVMAEDMAKDLAEDETVEMDTSSDEFLSSSSLSLVMSSVHDMFKCVRNLSSTLKSNISLLSNATHFMENTLSLLTVMMSLKEETAGILKSARTIRNEASLWKIKSSMIEDTASFVSEVSCTNFLSGMSQSKSSKMLHRTERTFQEPSIPIPASSSNLFLNEKCVSVSPERSSQTKSSSGSLSVCSLVPSNSNRNSFALDASNEFSLPEDSHSVRRSVRSKSIVDHLVYWPSFKKQGSNQSRSLPSKLRSSKRISECSSEALGSLVLKREFEAEDNNPSKKTGEEKWSIVPKRKVPKNAKDAPWKLKIKLKSSVESNSTQSSLSETETYTLEEKKEEGSEKGGLENKQEEVFSASSQTSSHDAGSSKVCNICGKNLTSNRNLKAHIRMHMGSSPFQCNHCYKIFSSSWNRAQHERVHTGEKPYVCNVCQESFRYNVTLRQHKLKCHSANS